MLKSHPSFYWVMSQFVQPLFALRDDMDEGSKIELITRCKMGLQMFLLQESAEEFLPRSVEKAKAFVAALDNWIGALRNGAPQASAAAMGRTLNGFSVSLQDELDRLATFTVTHKGNLSVDSLVKGAADGYPKAVLELLDDFITSEINYSGKCLAFELPTSSGFHILRAVEIGIKAYVHAATGSLPEIKNRNWGEYIRQLGNAGCGADFIGVLKVLKTKRNPLMHPQDSLETEEAIGLFCICQAALEALIEDVRKKSLETKFKESLVALPTL